MMIVIHHHLTTASKPAAKHAKPSSLKYADTTKRKTERGKKKTYIYLFIYSIGKGSSGGGGGGGEEGTGVGDCQVFRKRGKETPGQQKKGKKNERGSQGKE